MAHQYIESAEVDVGEYRIIVSTTSIDASTRDSWLALSQALELAVPTGLVRVELLELAAYMIFYFSITSVDQVDFQELDDLAGTLLQGAGLDEKEESHNIRTDVIMHLSVIFDGYLRMFLHIRKRFKINRDSLSDLSIRRLDNVVTSDEDSNDDATSSYVLTLH